MRKISWFLIFTVTVAIGEVRGSEADPLFQRTQMLEQAIATVALSRPSARVSNKQWFLIVGLFPEKLPADGQSVGFIVVKVKNRLGQPLEDVTVRFSSNAGRLLTKEGRTNAQGIACARLQSERLSSPRRVKVSVDAPLRVTVGWDFFPVQPKYRPKFDIWMRLHWMPVVPDSDHEKGQWQCVGEGGEVGGAAVPLLHVSPIPQFCWVDASFQELPLACPEQKGTMFAKPTFKRRCCIGSQKAVAFRLFVPGGWSRLHNSLYLLRTTVTVSDGKNFWVAGEKEMKVQVRNVVLKEIAGSSPILRCDEVGEPMIVRFTVDSLQEAPATFQLKIYEWLTDNLIAVLEKHQRIRPKTQQQFEFVWVLKPEIVPKLVERYLPFFFAYDLEVVVHQPLPEERDTDFRCSHMVEVGAPVDEKGEFILTAEYCGYEDKGTEDEGDDEHVYLFPRVLVNRGGIGIKRGKCLLFDPDGEKVWEWEWHSLQCITHQTYDALRASPTGIAHQYLVFVPVRVMEKAGTYYWTFVAYDDCPWRYKDHRPRLLLEAFRRPVRVKIHREWQ